MGSIVGEEMDEEKDEEEEGQEKDEKMVSKEKRVWIRLCTAVEYGIGATDLTVM